jgi:hypothetical protein
MRKIVIMPVLAALLCAVACGGDGGPTANDKEARVRFFSATTGMSGNGAFTTNGQFVTGSALAFGQSTPTCAHVAPGPTSFGFGAANGGGTALAGNALATLNNQTIAAGGNYTMVATGSAASPQLYLLDNSFTGSMSGNQAVVRFVNLAPGPNTLPNIFNVFAGGLPPAGTIIQLGLLVGSPTEFRTVSSGANAFTFLIGHQFETLVDVTVDLQAGTVNTLAIVPKTSGGYELTNIPRC